MNYNHYCKTVVKNMYGIKEFFVLGVGLLMMITAFFTAPALLDLLQGVMPLKITETIGLYVCYLCLVSLQ